MRKNVLAWALVLALGITNTFTVMGAEAEENVSVQEEITEEELEQAPEEETEEKDAAEKKSEESISDDSLENESDADGEKTAEEDKAAEGADEEKQEEIESAKKQQNENLEIGTVVDRGSCGEHLTYTITVNGKDEEGNDTYTLEIEGYGDMKDYDYRESNNNESPWASEEKYKKFIIELILPEGLTSIGNYAFYACDDLTGDLKIPDSVMTIGDGAFAYCSAINSQLHLPRMLKELGESAFEGCRGLMGDLV